MYQANQVRNYSASDESIYDLRIFSPKAQTYIGFVRQGKVSIFTGDFCYGWLVVL